MPSRVHPGEFFALPQSPQIFKQILMIAGMDRYFQIVRCFRDEDLRADRQPEFTQIDVEMSFANGRRSSIGVVEGAIDAMFTAAGFTVPRPFPRVVVRRRDAEVRVGQAGPAARDGDCGRELRTSAIRRSRSSARPWPAEGVVRGFVVPGGAKYSRKDLDELTDRARQSGASGLVWVRLVQGALQSSALKTPARPALRAAFERRAAPRAACCCWRRVRRQTWPPACSASCGCTSRSARACCETDDFRFVWVTEFPLFEWNPDEQRWNSMHHPFTSPRPEDVPLLESAPDRVRARAYDLALNGSEIAGGSIRIHRADVQRHVFRLLGIGRR